MIKTFLISYRLKIAYSVNTILHALKQIPLIKKLLPAELYRSQGLKTVVTVFAVIKEILSTFFRKLVYLVLMVFLYCRFATPDSAARSFLHVLFFLTLVGSFLNNSIIEPSEEKYYAINLMRMDARKYTVTNYGYDMLCSAIGFLPFLLLFGILCGVPAWLCLLLPLSITGCKYAVSALALRLFLRKGSVLNESGFIVCKMLLALLLCAAAYLLPLFGLALPGHVSAALLLCMIPLGVIGFITVLRFPAYKEINQKMMAKSSEQLEAAAGIQKRAAENQITADAGISSSKEGFEYLNELFVKRHRKILWKASFIIAGFALVLSAVLLVLVFLDKHAQSITHKLLLNHLTVLPIVMYAINRGTNISQTMFMNCDHSLLTYSVFKTPANILKLFRIRLREIIKINLLPAGVIGCTLTALLALSGGSDQPVNFAVMLISPPALSVFFSIHYLTIYYLLQPYTAGTELKSGTYPLIMSATYIICYMVSQFRIPTFIFGLAVIGFCIVYSLIACLLVYKLAPKAFRLRS